MSFVPPPPSKTHKDENFPVASVLIAPAHRATIMAFYRFARSADDVADDPVLTAKEKLFALDDFESTLKGRTDVISDAVPLRLALAEHNLSPHHALDLLQAFRMDAVKKRYETWDELMLYCAYSAAPVGRFVLDVHGESESTWPASDALCAALQIINHLQDCVADYHNIDRVYIPLDGLTQAGFGVEALDLPAAPPALRAYLKSLAEKTNGLVAQGAALPGQVRDFRLCLETAIIVKLAQTLTQRLIAYDPLSEPVRLTKPGFLIWTLAGVASGLRTFARRKPRSAEGDPS
ncbi:squalene synthase HpnC [Methyloferula stellata]|uniref:squalene synthase HpnC n=1 Tax=Methyloferula stellata TaxID=876270 RepID=UPI0003809836|nr:squalene synthase HpnC [Methyloferula stellata]